MWCILRAIRELTGGGSDRHTPDYQRLTLWLCSIGGQVSKDNGSRFLLLQNPYCFCVVEDICMLPCTQTVDGYITTACTQLLIRVGAFPFYLKVIFGCFEIMQSSHLSIQPSLCCLIAQTNWLIPAQCGCLLWPYLTLWWQQYCQRYSVKVHLQCGCFYVMQYPFKIPSLCVSLCFFKVTAACDLTHFCIKLLMLWNPFKRLNSMFKLTTLRCFVKENEDNQCV